MSEAADQGDFVAVVVKMLDDETRQLVFLSEFFDGSQNRFGFLAAELNIYHEFAAGLLFEPAVEQAEGGQRPDDHVAEHPVDGPGRHKSVTVVERMLAARVAFDMRFEIGEIDGDHSGATLECCPGPAAGSGAEVDADIAFAC